MINVRTREPLYNSASAGATLRSTNGKAVDWNSIFGASVVEEEHRAGLYVYGSTRHRNPYDRDGDGYSELGLLKGRMLGARSYLRTGQYGKLNAEYHNLYEYRRGGDCFDLPSPMAHISEGGDILDAYQKDLDSGPDRDSKYIYDPTLPRTLYIGAKIEI